MKAFTKKGFEVLKSGAKNLNDKALSSVGVGLVGGSIIFPTASSAAFTAPDLSGTVTDMSTAFGAVLTLVVAFLGFKYIKRMFV